MATTSPKTCRRGMTLVETLVVVAVIGILAGLLMPAVLSAREAARRAQCANQIKQLALALHNYHSAKTHFPPGVDCDRPGSISLFVFILPQLDQGPLYEQWNKNVLAKNAVGGPSALTATLVPGLVCPSDSIAENPVEVLCGKAWYGITSYGGNGGTRSYPPGKPAPHTDGVFFATGTYSCPKQHQIPVSDAMIKDGLSQTLFLGERSHHDPEFDRLAATESERGIGEYGQWCGAINSISLGDVTLSTAAPLNYRVPEGGGSTGDAYLATRDLRICAFGSNHPGGGNFAFADGAVRFLNDGIDQDVYVALSTRAGGESVAAP